MEMLRFWLTSKMTELLKKNVLMTLCDLLMLKIDFFDVVA